MRCWGELKSLRAQSVGEVSAYYSHWGPSRAKVPCARETRALKFQRICGSARELVVHIFVSLV